MKLALAPDLSLPINAATETFAFIGRKGSGKSYGAGKLAELLIDADVQIVVLDTVGNWHGLRLSANGKSPGIEIPFLGGLRGDIPLEATGGALIADVLVDSNRSLVVDISQFSKADRQRFAHAFGQQLWKRKKAEMQPTPIHLFLEEAQLIVPEQVRGETAGMVGIYEEIIRLGRNYGIGVSMLSQRPQSVNKEVLNQTECLLVFQVNGAHERKALREWIVHQGMDVRLLDELPSLKPGDCYVWSPQWLQILKRIHIAPKRTFDSTATPKVGSTLVRAREMKPINLEDLVAKMSASIERAAADDPKRLRARIAELQRELAAANKQESDPKDWERRLKSAFRGGLIDGYNKALHDIAGEISVRKCQEQLESALAGLKALNKALQKTLHAEPGLVSETAKRPNFIPKNIHASAPTTRPNKHSGNSHLRAGAVRILRELAARYPAGYSRPQVGVLTRFTHTGGTFTTYMGDLRRTGYIEEHDGLVYATLAGIESVGAGIPQAPTSHTEAMAMWRGALRAGAFRMLEAVVAVGPAGISRDAIADAVNMEKTGGTFSTYLGDLRRNGLITERGGIATANDILFP